jgi:hypothetical protein
MCPHSYCELHEDRSYVSSLMESELDLLWHLKQMTHPFFHLQHNFGFLDQCGWGIYFLRKNVHAHWQGLPG